MKWSWTKVRRAIADKLIEVSGTSVHRDGMVLYVQVMGDDRYRVEAAMTDTPGIKRVSVGVNYVECEVN